MSEQPNPPSPQFSSPREAKAHARADKAYRKATRPWYKKKRFWLLGIVALFAVIAIASALSGGGNSPDPTSDNSEATNPASSGSNAQDTPTKSEPAFPGAKDSDTVGQAGDELTLGGIAITAEALAAGDATVGETLCAPVTLKNNSDETVDFNMFDWKLQDPSGTIRNTGITGSDNQISTGQIAPGGTTSGDVCFDGEATATGTYVVLYEPFFADRGAWVNER